MSALIGGRFDPLVRIFHIRAFGLPSSDGFVGYGFIGVASQDCRKGVLNSDGKTRPSVVDLAFDQEFQPDISILNRPVALCALPRTIVCLLYTSRCV